VARNRDIPAWAAGYIGIPFVDRGRDRKGCDCWGLKRMILAEQFGVDVPSYDDAYFSTVDPAELRRVYEEEEHSGKWIEVMRGYDKPGDERPGDVVLMRMSGQPTHVGVVIAKGVMLHTEKDVNSATANIDGFTWKNRVIGIYRHRALA